MQQIVMENWWLVVIALVIGLLVAWWIFAATRKTRVERDAEEADAPKAAMRNQSLIDAPTAGSVSPTVPPAAAANLAGAGTAVAAAAEQAAQRAEAQEATMAEPAEPERAEAAGASEDDLRQIKGVGPKLVTQLHSLGVTSFAQIAGWTDADIDRIDAQLGRFQGRIRRDSWVEQARLLASGDDRAFAEKFGNS